MKYTAINEDWTTEYETNSKKEIDEFIAKRPDIFQVLYRKKDDYPLHVYYNSGPIDMNNL
jgi:hypothetical protein